MFCASTVSELPWFFPFQYTKKWTSIIKNKTVLVSPDVSLTSVVIRQLHPTWRTDVSPDN
jgi:hypothetical protein